MRRAMSSYDYLTDEEKGKYIVHVSYMSRGRAHKFSKRFKTSKEALAFEESIERTGHVSVGMQIK